MSSISNNRNENQPSTGLSSTIEALKREQQRRRELEHYISWEDKLFRNRHISAGQKLRLRALRRSVERGKTRDDAGRTRINLTTISEDTGESPDSISRAIKFFEKCNLVPDKKLVPETQENGEQWKRWYISLNQELLTHPDQIVPPEPRNHGGDRTYICPECGKKHLIKRKKVTLICKDCGHESLLSETDEDLSPPEEQDAACPPEQESDADKNFCEQDRNLLDVLKPVAPPIGRKLQGGPDGDLEVEQENPVDLGAAAELLLSLAGDSDEHIEMSRTGQKKYYTVHRRLNLDDVLDHLRGGQARGGLCCYADGKTRGLCWDADDQEMWELLQRAARVLAEAGYLPLLEESPASRGGHLWVIYVDLVDAIAARRHLCELVPELQDLEEYWPGPQDAASWNRVRLPGGRYVRYGKHVETPVKAWCKLVSVADGETSQDGQAAAALLLSHQTPVDLVPTSPSHEHVGREVWDVPESALAGVGVGASQPGMGEISQPIDPSSILRSGENEKDVAAIGSESERVLPVVDACWTANYGDVQTTTFWFAIVEDYSAVWFNDHHSLEEIRPRERNGMALSPNGSERSASTGYHVTPDGERYTDFSTHGRLPDGRHDSGDALELAMKVWDRSKSSILAETAREITCQARTEMEAAARGGMVPPAWVQELMTPAGWRRYDQVRASTVEAAGVAREDGSSLQTTESVAEGEIASGTDQTANWKVGDLVVWNQELHGGYGYIWQVDGEITKINKKKITIRVQKKDGTLKEIAVKPESLVPRPGVQKDAVAAVPSSSAGQELSYDAMCDYIKAYGARHDYPLVRVEVGGELVEICEGERAWKRFLLMLVATREQRIAVYRYLVERDVFML